MAEGATRIEYEFKLKVIGKRVALMILIKGYLKNTSKFWKL